MIRKSTWVILVILILVVGGAFLFNHYKGAKATAATPTPGTALLFPAQDGLPTDIKIADSAGDSVEIARNSSGVWVLQAPTAAPADQSQAEAGASQISALQVLGNLQIGLAVVGLDKPAYVLSATFSSGKTHKLNIGSSTPIQTGYYVQLDGGPIQIADKPGLDALLKLLSSPPYVPTATPLASNTPAATDTPTAGNTETPVVAATSTVPPLPTGSPVAASATPVPASSTATP